MQTHRPGSLRGPVLGHHAGGPVCPLSTPTLTPARPGAQQPPGTMGGERVSCFPSRLPLGPGCLQGAGGAHGGSAPSRGHHVPRGCRSPQPRRLRPLQLCDRHHPQRGRLPPHRGPIKPFGLGTSGIFVHTGLQREAGNQGQQGRVYWRDSEGQRLGQRVGGPAGPREALRTGVATHKRGDTAHERGLHPAVRAREPV